MNIINNIEDILINYGEMICDECSSESMTVDFPSCNNVDIMTTDRIIEIVWECFDQIINKYMEGINK